MAHDHIAYYPSAADLGLYAVLRNRADGTVWNGTALGAWSDAAIDTYDVALIFLGGDAYGFTVPSTLTTGKNYVAAFYRRASVGAAAAITDTKLPDEWEFAWSGAASAAPGPGAADWVYADQQDVEDLIGVDALRLISNEPGAASDTATDTARVQRTGLLMDQYIDARMSALGYVTPLANMSAGTILLIADASAKLVAWKLNEPRMLASISSSRQASSIDKIMQEHRSAAESMLSKIAYRSIVITADRLYTRPAYGKVYVPTAADVLATREALAIQQ